MGLMLAGDVWWWAYANRSARRAKLARGWRIFIGIMMSSLMLGIFLLLAARVFQWKFMVMPEWGVIVLFLWHFIVLPAVLLPSLIHRATAGVVSMVKKSSDNELSTAALSRRAFMARVVVVAPPVATAVLAGRSVVNADDVIIRRRDVPIASLPKELDGMTIAHVSDPHVGSFMSDAKFKRIIDLTNSLDADLVLQSGDLINASLSDLPDGIEMMRQFRSRSGVYCCSGNHDYITNRDTFETENLRAGVNLLLDETRTIAVRGQRVAIVAPRWWGGKPAVQRWSVLEPAKKIPIDAFAICLAHHPHCFDYAVEAGIPLTLVGHTHGGQLALTQNIGFGPLMYKYWNGLYRQQNAVCNVSVGTGNWFPLRFNVPCEIIQLTLRRA